MNRMNAREDVESSDIVAKPYRRILTPDPSGGYTASIHEFPGCIGYGLTPDLAIQDLDRNAESWVSVARETGYPVPQPVEYSEFSGKIALRISRRLHKMAVERSAIEGISTNQMLSIAVAHYLGQRDGIDAAVRGLKQSFDSIFAIAGTQPIAIKLEQKDLQVMSSRPKFLETKVTSGLLNLPSSIWYPLDHSVVAHNG